MIKNLIILFNLSLIFSPVFSQTYYPLSGVVTADTTFDWSNPNLITIDNDWSNIPFMKGFRGGGLTSVLDVDPRTITVDGTATPVVIYANQSDPNTFNGDGFAEFESLANPTIAFKASSTASAPFLMFYFNTIRSTQDFYPTLNFVLRDIDGTSGNAVQQVSIQYRIGESGPFIPADEFFYAGPLFDVAEGYQPDATRGPFLSGHESYCTFAFPLACVDQPKVQIRIMITHSSGGDEWVGIDDIRFGGAYLLPIKLQTFSAIEKNGSVMVNWTASTEDIMESFEVERSTDAVNFIKLESLKAKGTGNHNYVFTDISPVKGTGFYRLKLNNSNGSFFYSNISSVTVLPKDIRIHALYPNITSSKINLLITANKNFVADLQILNTLGSVVQRLSHNLSAGNNIVPIHVSGLSPGNYFIRININGELFTERFIKQ